MSLETRFKIAITADLTNALDLSTPRDKLEYESVIKLLSGTGLDQADLVFHDQRTLGGASNEDLDLAGGLTDPFGATLTFVKVKGLLIAAAAANGSPLNVGPAAVNGFTSPFNAAADHVNVVPGGRLLLIAPSLAAYAVTAGTGDLLNINNPDAAAAIYDVVIVGTSA